MEAARQSNKWLSSQSGHNVMRPYWSIACTTRMNSSSTLSHQRTLEILLSSHKKYPPGTFFRQTSAGHSAIRFWKSHRPRPMVCMSLHLANHNQSYLSQLSWSFYNVFIHFFLFAWLGQWLLLNVAQPYGNIVLVLEKLREKIQKIDALDILIGDGESDRHFLFDSMCD